jgi:hypothetical protein
MIKIYKGDNKAAFHKIFSIHISISIFLYYCNERMIIILRLHLIKTEATHVDSLIVNLFET